MAPRLILAAATPRRRELLVALLLPFEIMLPPAREPHATANSPEAVAEELALAKAEAVATRLPENAIVIGADTLVVDGADLLGKPDDAADARAMLRRLSGGSHRVVTGIAVVNRGRDWLAHETSLVRMRNYSAAEIERYVARGEPFDKAGGYAIQDPVFHPVASYEGCYYNIVGLPLCGLAELLGGAGVAVPRQAALEHCLDCERCPAAEGVEAAEQ